MPSPPAPQDDRSKESKTDDERDTLASWYRMAGVGIEFVVAVGLFAVLGYFADRWLGTEPWLLLAGMGLGFAVGLRAMIRMARRTFDKK